ncbi:MAG: hypothetical protein JO347_10005, partial [Candidatus Eremiobacteraeota bacterium]|nr:hypothetical protein [Candidatus Eremiobacteraeota bacterium]
DLAGAHLNLDAMGSVCDARFLRDSGEGASPQGGSFTAAKTYVAFDLLGIVAAVMNSAVAGGSSGIRAVARYVLETRFVPIDLAWLVRRLSADELRALSVQVQSWTWETMALVLQDAIGRELAARRHASAVAERARKEAAWARRVARQYAAAAKRRIAARAAARRRRRLALASGV